MGKKGCDDSNKSLLVNDYIQLTSKQRRRSAEYKSYLWNTNNSNHNDGNYRESSCLRIEIKREPR